MMVSNRNLDGLVGLSGSASELYGVDAQSGVSSGEAPTETLGSATVEVTNSAPPGASVGTNETFTVTSVDEATSTAVVTFSFFGVAVEHFTETILGYSPGAILFGDVSAQTVATYLDQNDDGSLDGELGLFTTTSLGVGDVLTLSGDDTYAGAAATLTTTTTTTTATTTTTSDTSTSSTPSSALPTVVLPTVPVLPTVTVAALPTQATVAGGGTNTLTLNFATAALAARAQPELTAISAAIATGSTVWGVSSNGVPPVLAAGLAGLAEIDAGGNVSLPAGYTAVADLASSAVNVIAAAAGNHLIVAGGGGDLTYAAVAGADTIYAGAGANLDFGADASLNVFGGDGAATIIGGAVGNTVAGGSGNLLLFASNSMTYAGAGGAATVIGGGGKLTADLGSGGGVAYGGVTGGDALSTSSSARSVLVGGGDGDVLTASGSGADILVAGAGAETIDGSASTGNLVIFGGPGSDVLSGGAGDDLFVAEPGNETLTGGGGGDSYAFINFGATARTEVITDFDPSKDALLLYGYGAQASAAALASTTVSADAATMTLADGTHIIFAGAPTLTANNVF